VSATSFVVLTSNDNGADGGSGVYFAPFGAQPNAQATLSVANSNVVFAPATCHASNLNVGASVTGTAGGSGSTATITLLVGTGLTPTATSLSCQTGTIAAGLGNTGSCTDLVHSVSIAAGNSLSLKFTQSADVQTITFGVSFICQ
jgi:hypothetical protein